MNASLRNDGRLEMTDGWEAVKLQVYQLVNKFVTLNKARGEFHGTVEEVLSDVADSWCSNFRRYDPHWRENPKTGELQPAMRSWKGVEVALTTWTYWQVFYRLKDVRGEAQRRIERNGEPTDQADAFPDERHRFDLVSFLRELGDDARIAVQQAILTGDNGKRRDVTSCLMGLGWCGERITETFGEIRDALTA